MMDELAALREENAQEREAHLLWKAEAHRLADDVAALRAENARWEKRHGEMYEDWKATTNECARLRAHVAALLTGRDDEVDCLRAHVAALVQALETAITALGMDAGGYTATFWRKVKAPLDAPDLAALGAREQARDAVIAAAREIFNNLPDGPHQEWEVPLADALDALDALRAGTTPEGGA
jgi:hypothetical protein